MLRRGLLRGCRLLAHWRGRMPLFGSATLLRCGRLLPCGRLLSWSLLLRRGSLPLWRRRLLRCGSLLLRRRHLLPSGRLLGGRLLLRRRCHRCLLLGGSSPLCRSSLTRSGCACRLPALCRTNPTLSKPRRTMPKHRRDHGVHVCAYVLAIEHLAGKGGSLGERDDYCLAVVRDYGRVHEKRTVLGMGGKQPIDHLLPLALQLSLVGDRRGWGRCLRGWGGCRRRCGRHVLAHLRRLRLPYGLRFPSGAFGSCRSSSGLCWGTRRRLHLLGGTCGGGEGFLLRCSLSLWRFLLRRLLGLLGSCRRSCGTRARR